MAVMTLENAREAKVGPVLEAAQQYAAFTVGTARYPTQLEQLAGNVSAGVLYTSIGLSNEVGELAELFGVENYNEKERLTRYGLGWKELGDVQWYAARLCEEMPDWLSYPELVKAAYVKSLDSKAESRMSGFDLQAHLCAYSGRVLGVVKKMMRDGSEWSEEKVAEKRKEMQEQLGKLIFASVDFAERTGPLVGCYGGYVTLIRDNADKLQDRKDRGVLKGDGDNR